MKNSLANIADDVLVLITTSDKIISLDKALILIGQRQCILQHLKAMRCLLEAHSVSLFQNGHCFKVCNIFLIIKPVSLHNVLNARSLLIFYSLVSNMLEESGFVFILLLLDSSGYILEKERSQCAVCIRPRVCQISNYLFFSCCLSFN